MTRSRNVRKLHRVGSRLFNEGKLTEVEEGVFSSDPDGLSGNKSFFAAFDRGEHVVQLETVASTGKKVPNIRGTNLSVAKLTLGGLPFGERKYPIPADSLIQFKLIVDGQILGVEETIGAYATTLFSYNTGVLTGHLESRRLLSHDLLTAKDAGYSRLQNTDGVSIKGDHATAAFSFESPLGNEPRADLRILLDKIEQTI